MPYVEITSELTYQVYIKRWLALAVENNADVVDMCESLTWYKYYTCHITSYITIHTLPITVK